MSEFSEVVRDDIWTILSRKYTTVRHGGHPSDIGEDRQERTFWPDMQFHRADVVDAPGGKQIRIMFTPIDDPEAVYGYRVDVERAAAAWTERVGIREPRKQPAMFAAELIWYMIAYIGVTDLVACGDEEDGVRWINTGADVFKPLPEPLAFSHAG